MGQASLAAYVQWVHSHRFVNDVLKPERFAKRHVGPFRRWAVATSLVFEEAFLLYLHLGLVPLPAPSFLQGCLKAYSIVRRWSVACIKCPCGTMHGWAMNCC